MAQINLFNIYRVSTFSQTDIWTAEEVRRKNKPNNLIGQYKVRYAVPIEWLRETKDGKDVYLIAHINGTTPTNKKIKYIDMNRIINTFPKIKNKIYGNVLEINVRIAVEDEFKDFNVNNQLKIYGDIFNDKRKWLRKRVYKIMKSTPRKALVSKIKTGNFDGYDSSWWDAFTKRKQFNIFELTQRTNDKLKYYNRRNEIKKLDRNYYDHKLKKTIYDDAIIHLNRVKKNNRK